MEWQVDELTVHHSVDRNIFSRPGIDDRLLEKRQERSHPLQEVFATGQLRLERLGEIYKTFYRQNYIT
jgi:hypothetical protein